MVEMVDKVGPVALQVDDTAIRLDDTAIRVAEEVITHRGRPGIYGWAAEALGLLEDIKAIRDRNTAEDATVENVLRAGVVKVRAEKTLAR